MELRKAHATPFSFRSPLVCFQEVDAISSSRRAESLSWKNHRRGVGKGKGRQRATLLLRYQEWWRDARSRCRRQNRQVAGEQRRRPTSRLRTSAKNLAIAWNKSIHINQVNNPRHSKGLETGTAYSVLHRRATLQVSCQNSRSIGTGWGRCRQSESAWYRREAEDGLSMRGMIVHLPILRSRKARCSSDEIG